MRGSPGNREVSEYGSRFGRTTVGGFSLLQPGLRCLTFHLGTLATTTLLHLGGQMSHTRFKLSVMMFLEFFIWGAWLPKIFGYLDYLKFDALQQGLILNAFALASLTAMFFSTQFADRTFAAEKFLAFSQLVGGLALLALTWVTDFWPFFVLMLVHCLLYVPTISITNSIAFANLQDPQKEFGPVRLWGTIGWIAASWPFVFILSGENAEAGVRYTYLVAGLASLALA